jgi:segregation and condensation protein B
VLEGRARRLRLDAEALDALAVVAWNQPLARGRLVELGCDARPAALRALVRRGLLALDRSTPDEEPRYVTTPRFLEVFRLERIEDLPKPTEPPG